MTSIQSIRYHLSTPQHGHDDCGKNPRFHPRLFLRFLTTAIVIYGTGSFQIPHRNTGGRLFFMTDVSSVSSWTNRSAYSTTVSSTLAPPPPLPTPSQPQSQRRRRRNPPPPPQTITTSSSKQSQSPQQQSQTAPFVDSTLLRFLSEQRTQISIEQQQQQQQQQQREAATSSSSSSSSSSTTTNPSLNPTPTNTASTATTTKTTTEPITTSFSSVPSSSKLLSTSNNDLTPIRNSILPLPSTTTTPTNTNTTTNTTTTTTNTTTTNTNTYQTSSQITTRLLSMNVPEPEAQAASQAVQGYMVARTARKRIRDFLRTRDSVWRTDVMRMDGMPNTEEKEGYGMVDGTDDDEEVVGTETEMGMGMGMDVVDWNDTIGKVMDVMVELGLTGRDIAAVFAHTPSVSMARVRGYVEENEDEEGEDNGNGVVVGGGVTEALEDTLDRVYKDMLCGLLKLRKYDARKVIRSCPGLLTPKGSSSAREVINILSTLHVSPTSLARDKASLPVLLSRSPASLFRLIAFLSSDAVRMPVDSIGPFLRRSMCKALLDRVAPLPNNLYQLFVRENRWMSPSSSSGREEDEEKKETEEMEMMELLWNGANEARSEDLVTSTYTQMARTAVFLREEVGIENMGKVVSTHPEILMIDIEERIVPFFDFVCDDLGIDGDDVPRVIESYPALLLTDLEDMKMIVRYLESLGVSEDMFPGMFLAFPSLLTLGIETNMKPVVEFLKRIGVTNVGRFITRLPPVLGYSVENELQPKWEFLKNVCQYASFEVRRFPAYFSYPLDRVIMSRYAYLREVKGVPVHLLPVDDIVRFGDVDFARVIAKDSNGAAYSSFVTNRRKNKTRKGGQDKNNYDKTTRRSQAEGSKRHRIR